MKKFYLFLLALICSVTGWATEITTGKAYVIKNNASSAYISISTTSSGEVSLQSIPEKIYFQTGATDGTYYISNTADAGKYINAWYWYATPSDNATEWTINDVDGGVRLQCSYGYLAPDNASAGAALWSDKAEDHAYGIFTIEDYDAKAILLAVINNANAQAGTNPGYLDATAVKALTDAAQAVYDNASATEAEVEAATTTLKEGIAALSLLQPTDGEKYFIINAKPAFEKNVALTTSSYNNWYGEEHTPGWEIKDINNFEQVWTLVANGDNFYIYNENAGKYLSYDSENGFTLSEETTNASATLTSVGSGQYNISVNGSAAVHTDGHGYYPDYWTGNGLIAYAGDANSPSAWYLEVAPTYVDVTYNYVLSGSTDIAFSTTVKLASGTTYPTATLPADNHTGTDYYTLSGAPEGTVPAEGATATITVTQNLPFVVSSSVEDATWYTITNGANKYYLYYEADADYMSMSRATTNCDDADLFCFVGNVVTGFTIYNKAAGSTKVLSSSSNPYDGNTGGSTYVTLQDKGTSGLCQSWDIQKSSNIEGGFYIAMHGLANNVRMNNRSGKLAFWNNNADTGSTFLIATAEDIFNTNKGIYAAAFDNITVGDMFCPATTEDIENFKTAIAAVTYDDSKSLSENLKALDAVRAAVNYVMPESGRYFIQSYCTITSDGETQHPYLANHYNLMGVGKSLLSYYSIWDVTKNDDGTYKIQNEGQRFLAEPMNLNTTSSAYLGYQSATNRTHFGCFAADEDAYTLDLCPAQFGYAGYAAIQVHNTIDSKNYAAYFDNNTYTGDDTDAKFGTNDIMAGTLAAAQTTGGDAAKQVFMWSFTKVTAAEELAMFQDQVENSLVGYVGGLESISESAARKTGDEWLQDVIGYISSAESRLSVSTYDSGAAQKDDAPVGAAEYMKKIFKAVNDNRNGVDDVTPSALHIKLKAGEHFYFENMHGNRPATYSRLHANGDYYTTSAIDDIESDAMINYMWYTTDGKQYTDDDGNVIAKSYNCYTQTSDGSSQTYLNRNSDQTVLFLNPNDDTKLNFNIVEVTPSMYVIKDMDYPTTDDKCYITVESQHNLTHYNYIELSTLWKLKTITTTEVTLNPDPEDRVNYRADLFDPSSTAVQDYTNAGKYDTTNDNFLDNYGNVINNDGSTYGAENRCYATYCPAIDMMVREDAGYTAYYVSDISENNTLTLKPVSIGSEDGINAQYLKGGSGYILISDYSADEITSPITKEIVFSNKSAAEVDAPSGNKLTGTLTDITVDDNKSIAVLNYVTPGKSLGHAVNDSDPDKEVYGVGMGFYNLAKGKTLSEGKAYIKLNTSSKYENTGDATFSEDTSSAVAMKFLIEDENGEETGIAELNADGTMTVQPKAIYDLSGRRVSKAQKGIYIVNGKKVMY